MPDQKSAWKKSRSQKLQKKSLTRGLRRKGQKPRKKDVMISANKSVSKPQNASKSNGILTPQFLSFLVLIFTKF
jgi:hypothetical protein